MRYKYRGQLNNKTVVDIIEFDGETAKCDNGVDINISEFNTIFVPASVFKSEFLLIEEVVEEGISEVEMFDIKPLKNKSK